MSDHQRTHPTTIGLTRGDKTVIVIGTPLLGLVIGWIAPRVSEWVADLPWLPYRAPFDMLASKLPWVPLVLLVVGGVAGLVLALIIIKSVLKIEVDEQQVTFRAGDWSATAQRRDVRAAFYDGKQLVLVDAADRELMRGEPERKPAKVEAIFRQYGYRWLDADPYAHQFQRWVPNMPDLPGAADALLAARAVALQDDDADDARELRAELAALDVVVRDQRGKQYVRRSGEPT